MIQTAVVEAQAEVLDEAAVLEASAPVPRAAAAQAAQELLCCNGQMTEIVGPHVQ
jgi:glycerate-2-kinase